MNLVVLNEMSRKCFQFWQPKFVPFLAVSVHLWVLNWSCFSLSHLSCSYDECLLAWRHRCLIIQLLRCFSGWRSKVKSQFLTYAYDGALWALGGMRNSWHCLLAATFSHSWLLGYMLQRNTAFPVLAVFNWQTVSAWDWETEKAQDFHENMALLFCLQREGIITVLLKHRIHPLFLPPSNS